MTSTVQKPKQDWLNIVKTSRAKAKIRLALKETQVKDGLYAKEMLERRMKNRKIEMDEGTMSHLIKKLGFKETNDFYRQIADETLDINHVIENIRRFKLMTTTSKVNSRQEVQTNIALRIQSRILQNPMEMYLSLTAI